MAIYPVIAGQKPNQRHVIPPHSPSAETSKQLGHLDDETEGHTSQPPAEDNLIDFGEVSVQHPVVPAVPQLTPNHEIASLLNSTGKPAEGPLIDFTDDLKKDLPSDTQR